MASEEKKLISGDDPISDASEDWFDFYPHAKNLIEKLYQISKTSSICCAVIGGWGSGKTSFMHLMKKYVIEKGDDWNAVSVWFVAWDPGGITNMGDAILLHIFNEVVSYAENKSLNDVSDIKKNFDNLKEALGLRKSFSQQMKGILGTVEEFSSTIPIVQDAAKLGKTVFQELQSSKNIRDSFTGLSDYLEKDNLTVFLFIDEIDRASGEQVYNVLSELKSYLNQKHVIIMLGYDENYVIESLTSNLPEGINAHKYIEKIISVRKKIPLPSEENLIDIATKFLEQTYINKDDISIISQYAVQLSNGNPRKLKRILLSFYQHLPMQDKIETYELLSLILITALDESGLLKISAIRNSFLEEDGSTLIRNLNNLEDKELKEDSTLILKALKDLEEEYWFEVSSAEYLGIPTSLFGEKRKKTKPKQGYDWRIAIEPLLSKAIKIGFHAPKNLFDPEEELIITPSNKIEPIPEIWNKYLEYYALEGTSIYESNENKLAIIIMSFTDRIENMCPYIPEFLNNAPFLANDKDVIIWLINDEEEEMYPNSKELYERAKNISKGMKYKINFYHTPNENINELVSFLFDVCTAD